MLDTCHSGENPLKGKGLAILLICLYLVKLLYYNIYMLFYYIGIGGNSIAFPFPSLLVCLYAFRGSLLLFFCFLMGFSLLFIFNIIARSALFLLFFSRACFCFLVVFFCYVYAMLFLPCPSVLCCFRCVCYAIKSAPCSGNAKAWKHRSRRRWRNGGKGNASAVLVLLAWLPLLSVHNISLCAGFACGGLHHRPPGVLFRYGLREKISQIRLAHPNNPLFLLQIISCA